MKTKQLSDQTVDSIITEVEKNLSQIHNRQDISLAENMKSDLRKAIKQGSLETEKTPIDQEKVAAQISNYISMNMRDDALEAPKQGGVMNFFRRAQPTKLPTQISRTSMEEFETHNLEMLCSEVSNAALKAEARQQREAEAQQKIESALAKAKEAAEHRERKFETIEEIEARRQEAAEKGQRRMEQATASLEAARQGKKQTTQAKVEAAAAKRAEIEAQRKVATVKVQNKSQKAVQSTAKQRAEEAKQKRESAAAAARTRREKQKIEREPEVVELAEILTASTTVRQQAGQHEDRSLSKQQDVEKAVPHEVPIPAIDRQQADALLDAAQSDHSAHQDAADKQRRAEAKVALQAKLTEDLRSNIKAARNTSWLSYTGEYHVERDELAGIMAEKIADKVVANPGISTKYLEDHAADISTTAIETMKTQKMVGTAEINAMREEEITSLNQTETTAAQQDKTFQRISEEFLENRKNVADIREVLIGGRKSGVSFDDKLAEATSEAVAQKAAPSHQQAHQRGGTRGMQTSL